MGLYWDVAILVTLRSSNPFVARTLNNMWLDYAILFAKWNLNFFFFFNFWKLIVTVCHWHTPPINSSSTPNYPFLQPPIMSSPAWKLCSTNLYIVQHSWPCDSLGHHTPERLQGLMMLKYLSTWSSSPYIQHESSEGPCSVEIPCLVLCQRCHISVVSRTTDRWPLTSWRWRSFSLGSGNSLTPTNLPISPNRRLVCIYLLDHVFTHLKKLASAVKVMPFFVLHFT